MPSPAVLAVVIAHQGGWDEALVVAVPVVMIVLVLREVNRRARLDRSDQNRPGPDDGPDRDGP